MSDLGQHVKRRFRFAQSIRQNWESHWQQVADLVQPSRQFTVERFQGSKTNLKIVNDVAPLAANSLAAALFGLPAEHERRYEC